MGTAGATAAGTDAADGAVGMSLATTYRHRGDCPGERMGNPRIGREGDVLTQCRNCRMLTVTAAVVEPAPEPEPAPMVVSGYVCRAHPEQPVTWRGTGCSPCADERQQSRAVRLKRRREGKELEGR
jgi:hypothetical protein